MNHVIAVASIVGGGKTSFVKTLSESLNDATTIHYDHYERVTEESVHNLKKWVQNGADFNDFVIPKLPEDLKRLKQGKSVIDPLTDIEIRPDKYIIFEMPLGKEHRLTAPYIDLLIWIEVPFDMALARKIREFTANFLEEGVNYNGRIVWLDKYLDNYLNIVRDVLRIQKERVSMNADIIIDGQEDLETMVQKATKEILHRMPR